MVQATTLRLIIGVTLALAAARTDSPSVANMQGNQDPPGGPCVWRRMPTPNPAPAPYEHALSDVAVINSNDAWAAGTNVAEEGGRPKFLSTSASLPR